MSVLISLMMVQYSPGDIRLFVGVNKIVTKAKEIDLIQFFMIKLRGIV